MLGRPMPIFSNSRVSEASLKRLGGCVVWLLDCQFAALQRLAHRHLRQHDLALGKFAVGIVGAFDVGTQVAGEVDDLPAGLEICPVEIDADRDPPRPGVRHLAGNGPLPDQVVKPKLVGTQAVPQVFRQRERLPAGRIASWASWAFLTLV